MSYEAIVIGGGLAGCSAARQLAQRGYSVCLLEQTTYPRHKLCGEFLSPESQASFRRLGVLATVAEAGAQSINRVRLSDASGRSTEHALPDTAWGLSRYRLDALLFRTACAAGAEGRPDTRATDVRGTLDRGFVVKTTAGPVRGDIVLGAYGRRSRLDRTFGRPFLETASPYVAFKAHFEGPSVPASIEVHSAPGGYCGVSPIEARKANVCWIGRVDTLKSAGGTAESMLSVLRENPALNARLRGLTRISDRFEAVSQVPLMSKAQIVDDVCMIGDAAGMIAPLCGDGMAMALEAADLIVPLAAGLIDDRLPPDVFRDRYQCAWQKTFDRRMQMGRWIHAAAFRPGAAAVLVQACRLLPPIARWLIRTTRGSTTRG